MPPRQLRDVLDRAWGEQWHRRFRQFSHRPIAAASIGQVHQAVAADGRDLAIKVQYPGVRRSIDSDVDDLAGLLELFRLWPAEVDLGPVLQEARRQLHQEADCGHEATQIAAYRTHLGSDPDFVLPEVDPALTTPQVLGTAWWRQRRGSLEGGALPRAAVGAQTDIRTQTQPGPVAQPGIRGAPQLRSHQPIRKPTTATATQSTTPHRVSTTTTRTGQSRMVARFVSS